MRCPESAWDVTPGGAAGESSEQGKCVGCHARGVAGGSSGHRVLALLLGLFPTPYFVIDG